MMRLKQSKSSRTQQQGGSRNLLLILVITGFVVSQIFLITQILPSVNHSTDLLRGEEQSEAEPNERETERETESRFGYLYNGMSIFKAKAEEGQPITDKVTVHTYEIMYGTLLLPYYHQHPEMKMLEIGLGCDMRYGPGASVWLWRELFPGAELWEAEYNGECVKQSKANGQLDGIQTLVGDQGDPSVLDRWIEESKGNFDVVIDDGGHSQCQIWTSFEKLWPTVKPGGLYFIEDLQVANHKKFKTSSPGCDGKNLNVPNKLKEILDRLMYEKPQSGDVEFLFCQDEACVLKKRPSPSFPSHVPAKGP